MHDIPEWFDYYLHIGAELSVDVYEKSDAENEIIRVIRQLEDALVEIGQMKG